uniref:Uncharacterized protein n=1 Tax=Arundo donax TaxID=35708 RepID=A0A0A8YF86_ARUDO
MCSWCISPPTPFSCSPSSLISARCSWG